MKKIGYVLVLLCSSLAIQAQPARSSLLWKVEGNGLTQPSYLFGTFHILCKNDFRIGDTLKQAFLSARRFYAEIDLDEPGQQMQLAMKMVMKDKSLPQLLSPSDYQQVSDSFQRITGMPLAMFNQFNPFVPMGMAIIHTIDCADKVQPENEFMSLARENGMDILGLETIQDQVDAIASQPVDSMVVQLKQMLLHFDSSRQVMRGMIDLYKKGNIDAIYSYMKSSGMDAGFETALLSDRNNRWIPLIEKAAAEKPGFFAVGAGHLGGTDGIISLLMKKGYQLSPVQY